MGNITNARTLSDEIQKQDREIREYFGQDTNEELSMKRDDIAFTLVRIDPSDEKNIRKFRPYCHGSPVGKYGVVWEAPCLRDFYVFDTREYAVDFIMLSCSIGS